MTLDLLRLDGTVINSFPLSKMTDNFLRRDCAPRAKRIVCAFEALLRTTPHSRVFWVKVT